MTSSIIYEGQLRTRCTHLSSGNEIITDAPIDNQGLGTAFSPTDLVATALGSCMLTIMGIRAASLGIDIVGTRIDITKEMTAAPRRIARIGVSIQMPQGHYTDIMQKSLTDAAMTCPVLLSLHPDIDKQVTIDWQ
jgi:putative redox protein